MSAITKSAPVAANEAKRRCVENTTPRGQSDSLCALDQESVLHVLGFLHFSDLNEFGSCSKACRVLRNSDRLNPTREGEIRFCRNRVLHVSDMIQSFAQLQLRGKFGKERTHLKICMKHVESTEVMSMREIRSALKSRDRLLDPLLHVTSLDISTATPSRLQRIKANVFKMCALMLPNLKTLDMSHCSISQGAVEFFSKSCPQLECVTWDGCNVSAFVTGQDLRHSANLREVSFQNASMDGGFHDRTVKNQEPPLLYFLARRRLLERVNVKGITWRSVQREEDCPITPCMFIKFVRSSPRLVWLKSDCPAETIAILKAERPEITFC